MRETGKGREPRLIAEATARCARTASGLVSFQSFVQARDTLRPRAEMRLARSRAFASSEGLRLFVPTRSLAMHELHTLRRPSLAFRLGAKAVSGFVSSHVVQRFDFFASAAAPRGSRSARSRSAFATMHERQLAVRRSAVA